MSGSYNLILFRNRRVARVLENTAKAPHMGEYYGDMLGNLSFTFLKLVVVKSNFV